MKALKASKSTPSTMRNLYDPYSLLGWSGRHSGFSCSMLASGIGSLITRLKAASPVMSTSGP